MRCPRCSSPLPEASRFCSSCGTPLDPPSVSPTQTVFPAGAPHPGASRSSRMGPSAFRPLSPASGGSGPGERFAPGTLLGERYRILGPLGRGGMGEVYRADDLKLAQPVALKFLPERLAGDEERLERLLGEVRIARQVSHPNVCRVYDVSEAEGMHFLSMEYVDGEDLATLIRRIGRLSPDKAVEIARQMCAGLAAAHERGVIHRDFKPANVMIDGRGKVRITDFGLAGLVNDAPGSAGRSGTPAYMAPEQLAGEDATLRSDLYSLGLVLYELFTGKAAFKSATSLAEMRRMREESEMPSPSTVIEDLDPAVERTIQRCLDPDPRLRPNSALAVAAALPGGDPLAAALAAGETPSPEMVAAAGEEGTLRPMVGMTCLAAFLVGLVALVALTQRIGIHRGGAGLPPEVLADRAHKVLDSIGTPPPVDSARGYIEHLSYLNWIREHDKSPRRWDQIERGRPPALLFWYRQSPLDLVPTDWNGAVDPLDPPATVSGMANVFLDLRGRLFKLERVPPQVVSGDPSSPAPSPDWPALFRAAELDPERFRPADPTWVPPDYADHREAWEGELPELPGVPIRIEAASFRGQPTYFQVIGPWTTPIRQKPIEITPATQWTRNILVGLLLVVLATGVFAAWRNLRLGRGDRRGATRIALYVFLAVMGIWVLGADHVPSLVNEWGMLQRALGLSMFLAGLVWVSYLALEPYVRRHWPIILVGWSRLLAGRWRDPRVARDVLVGALAGVTATLLFYSDWLIPAWLGQPAPRPLSITFGFADGAAAFAAGLTGLAISVVLNGMIMVAFLFVSLLIVRRFWLAAVVVWAVATVLTSVGGGSDLLVLDLLLFGLCYAIFAYVLTRFGALSLMVAMAFLMQTFPFTFDRSAWYAGYSLAALLLLAALGIYGFVRSRGRGAAQVELAGQAA